MINSKHFDNIRFIAVLSIIILHTNVANIENSRLSQNIVQFSSGINFFQILPHALYNNIFKAGTILFFIISGFLFEMQILKNSNSLSFFRRKAKSLLLPYLIIFAIPTLIIVGLIEPNYGAKEHLTLYDLLIRIVENIFLTNYWFVPALFITLTINYFISTKNLLKSLFVFVPLWAVAYINIYLNVINSSHTVWFVGFFFIFSLGRLMYIYNNQIANIKLLNSTKKLLLISFICYIISNLESILIISYGHNTDYINTLRIGNIAYSFSLFYLLNTIFHRIKFKLPYNISFYFIYLIHPFVLRVIDFILYKSNLHTFYYPIQFFYNSINFIVVFISCVILHVIFFKLRVGSTYLSEYVFKKKS